ncbi:hypothetical protein HYH02_007338 [Chlamydomonas schloesseri]|uniref:cyclin-dependent kinase n=1 Tax=Chlamydomonas schloesseri TaxID=2026947 RepID=A0A835WHZ1_9CHLO|nr:hypothetical protein HYH02_007338 [Chlamydomonas schloesseri]|eukprot:KAG2447882.1 hypothetical protein HYH02_007338 [Chlamydomonas schloesseri]
MQMPADLGAAPSDQRSYEFVQELDEGSYGCVFACVQRPSGRLVAVKVCKHTEDPVVRRLLLREVGVLRSLPRHPCVVELLDAFRSRSSGRPHLVFECMERSAQQELEALDETRMCPVQLKLVAWQAVMGLAHCHRNNVIHRDLKPGNILLAGKGAACNAKLCDFGFARNMLSGRPDMQERLSSYVVTRWYRAPEILVGDKYGMASDVWALGCTLAELSNGGLPLLPGTSSLDQLARIMRCCGPLPPCQALCLHANRRLTLLRKPPPRSRTVAERLPGVDPALVALVTACLQTDPALRPTARRLLAHPYFADVPRLLRGSPLQAELVAAAAELQPAPAPVATVLSLSQQQAAPKRATSSALLERGSTLTTPAVVPVPTPISVAALQHQLMRPPPHTTQPPPAVADAPQQASAHPAAAARRDPTLVAIDVSRLMCAAAAAAGSPPPPQPAPASTAGATASSSPGQPVLRAATGLAADASGGRQAALGAAAALSDPLLLLPPGAAVAAAVGQLADAPTSADVEVPAAEVPSYAASPAMVVSPSALASPQQQAPSNGGTAISEPAGSAVRALLSPTGTAHGGPAAAAASDRRPAASTSQLPDSTTRPLGGSGAAGTAVAAAAPPTATAASALRYNHPMILPAGRTSASMLGGAGAGAGGCSVTAPSSYCGDVDSSTTSSCRGLMGVMFGQELPSPAGLPQRHAGGGALTAGPATGTPLLQRQHTTGGEVAAAGTAAGGPQEALLLTRLPHVRAPTADLTMYKRHASLLLASTPTLPRLQAQAQAAAAAVAAVGGCWGSAAAALATPADHDTASGSSSTTQLPREFLTMLMHSTSNVSGGGASGAAQFDVHAVLGASTTAAAAAVAAASVTVPNDAAGGRRARSGTGASAPGGAATTAAAAGPEGFSFRSSDSLPHAKASDTQSPLQATTTSATGDCSGAVDSAACAAYALYGGSNRGGGGGGCRGGTISTGTITVEAVGAHAVFGNPAPAAALSLFNADQLAAAAFGSLAGCASHRSSGGGGGGAAPPTPLLGGGIALQQQQQQPARQQLQVVTVAAAPQARSGNGLLVWTRAGSGISRRFARGSDTSSSRADDSVRSLAAGQDEAGAGEACAAPPAAAATSRRAQLPLLGPPFVGDSSGSQRQAVAAAATAAPTDANGSSKAQQSRSVPQTSLLSTAGVEVTVAAMLQDGDASEGQRSRSHSQDSGADSGCGPRSLTPAGHAAAFAAAAAAASGVQATPGGGGNSGTSRRQQPRLHSPLNPAPAVVALAKASGHRAAAIAAAAAAAPSAPPVSTPSRRFGDGNDDDAMNGKRQSHSPNSPTHHVTKATLAAAQDPSGHDSARRHAPQRPGLWRRLAGLLGCSGMSND